MNLLLIILAVLTLVAALLVWKQHTALAEVMTAAMQAQADVAKAAIAAHAELAKVMAVPKAAISELRTGALNLRDFFDTKAAAAEQDVKADINEAESKAEAVMVDIHTGIAKPLDAAIQDVLAEAKKL